MPQRNYKRKPKRKMNKKKITIPRAKLSLMRADYSGRFVTEPGLISNDSAVQAKYSFKYQFSQCLSASSWVSLFDQYRINMVIVRFIPVQTELVNRPFDDTTNPGASVSEVPRFTVCEDRDDVAIPVDFNSVFQRQGSRTVKATQPLTWKLVPTRLSMCYRTPTSTGYTIDNATKKFVDCAQWDVPHYGLKCAMEATSPANAYQYRVETTYYISLKNRRY